MCLCQLHQEQQTFTRYVPIGPVHILRTYAAIVDAEILQDRREPTLENFWWPLSLSRQGAGPCTVSMMILVKEQFCSGTFPRANSSSTMPNDQMSADWLYLRMPACHSLSMPHEPLFIPLQNDQIAHSQSS